MISRMFKRMIVLAVVCMSLITADAQIMQSQLKTAGDEPLLREWIRTLASDEFGGRKPMTSFENKP